MWSSWVDVSNDCRILLAVWPEKVLTHGVEADQEVAIGWAAILLKLYTLTPAMFRFGRSVSVDETRPANHYLSDSESLPTFAHSSHNEEKFAENATLKNPSPRHTRSRSYHHRPRAHTLLSDVLLRSSWEKNFGKSRKLRNSCCENVVAVRIRYITIAVFNARKFNWGNRLLEIDDLVSSPASRFLGGIY